MQALKDPETAKEAARILKGDGEDKLAEILKDVEVTDDDTIESVSKKHQAKIQELVSYFNDRLDSVKAEAVEESTKDSRAAKEKEIKDFEAEHPKGMSNPEVIAIMQPLYDKGEPIADCYAKACRALELDPATGETPTEETPEEKAEREKAEKAKEKETKKVASNKSSLTADEEDDEDDDRSKSDEPLSLEESLNANANTLMAKPEFEGLFPE